MKTHKRILHVVIPARTVPVEGLTGPPEADPLVRTARGILILAVILGSLGTDAAVSSGYGSAGHASAHQQAASAHPIGSGHIANTPWMY